MSNVYVPGPNGWSDPARWVWPALVASLAVNLLVGGMLLGDRVHGPRKALPASKLAEAAGGEARVAGTLGPERRQQIRAIFEAHRGQNRADFQAVRVRRDEVVRILDAEPFDKTAYVAAMGRLLEAEGQARAALQPMFADIAATLSVSERRDFLTQHRHLRREILGVEGGMGGKGKRNGGADKGEGR